MQAFSEEDKLMDGCGVVGVYLCGKERSADAVRTDAARLACYGLYSLQHRGQESAGIAVSDGRRIGSHKGMGLVSDVFTAERLDSLSGHIAVAHVRHAASGESRIEDAQPLVNRFRLGGIAVAHNGQLVNHGQLRESLEETGAAFVSHSDTEVIVKLIAKNHKKGLERALTDTIQMIKGSFALAVMTESSLVGARDPNGIRPLCLGKLDDGWILASESCAIDAAGGAFVRDIQPGEIVIINEDGVLSFAFGEKTAKRTCAFEYVCFARPDSVVDGIAVHEARLRLGAALAAESPAPADVVIGVPDSGIGAAMGYSGASGIPYATGIVKNKYIGRAFIAPNQAEREKLVFVKLNALKSDVKGRRVVIIDDSVVRGTTCRYLVQILRRAGAKEVHFRVSSPPVRFPCCFGIDTPCRAGLISSAHNTEEVCRDIGADSLAFISVEGMMEALRGVNPAAYGYCRGCFTGEYPVSVPGELNASQKS